MEWFSGTVTEALSIYQKNNGILIVYIYHSEELKNENTAKFNQLWETFDKNILSTVSVVSIRLISESEGAKQFSQFFPTPVFPVCYIIGLNGQPLEVITPAEELTLERLNLSLKKSIELYRGQLKEKEEKTSQSVATESTGSTAIATEETNKESINNNNLEEKIRYARQLLEEKRKTDSIKKEEESRKKELERRNEGKLLAESREKIKEKELREAAEALRREKQADAQALNALREQIRLDKEERAKKNANVQNLEELKPTFPEPVINKPVDVDECRIQCKFPDGSTLVKTFPSKQSLQTVVDAIKQDGRLSDDFFLVQSYPRRQLKEMDKTFFELGLTPSSVLLVVLNDGKPLTLSSTAGTVTGYFQLFFGFILAPFASLLNFFSNFFGTHALTNTQTTNQQKKESNESVRRVGNIGRLRNDSDTSDAEGTWNGNSTQQL